MKRGADSALEHYLHEARLHGHTVQVFVRNGVKLTGRIVGFDKYSILLNRDGVDSLIFKSAVTTVNRRKQESRDTVPAENRV